MATTSARSYVWWGPATGDTLAAAACTRAACDQRRLRKPPRAAAAACLWVTRRGRDAEWYRARRIFCCACGGAVAATGGSRFEGVSCAGCHRWFHDACCRKPHAQRPPTAAEASGASPFFHCPDCRTCRKALSSAAARGAHTLPDGRCALRWRPGWPNPCLQCVRVGTVSFKSTHSPAGLRATATWICSGCALPVPGLPMWERQLSQNAR